MTSLISSLTAAQGSAPASFAPSSPSSAPASPANSSIPTRDDAIGDLATLSSSVNLLAQASSAQSASTPTASDPAEQLTLPPLPQTPATQPAPAAPTDDHGQSNVVFSDAEASSDLIH